MKKRSCILSFFVLLMIVPFAFAEDDFDFEKELERLSSEGKISPELIDNLDGLKDDQTEILVETLDSLEEDLSHSFWENWQDLKGKKKNAFWQKMSKEQRKTFTESYSKELGYSLITDSDNIAFSDNSYIGSKSGFLSLDKISEYNEDSKDKITEVSLIDDSKKRGLLVKKESGATARLLTDEEKSGFYFDPVTGEIKKIDPDGNIKKEDHLSGKWSGKGAITIDISKEEETLKLDFLRDENDNADIYNFASFKNSGGDAFSPHQKNTEKLDENGENVILKKEAEITFDDEGRVKKLSHAHWEGSKLGGDYGKDTRVLYDSDEYDSLNSEEKENLGSHILFDEENAKIVTKRALSEAGGLLFGNLETIERRINELDDAQKQEILDAEDFEQESGLMKRFGLSEENVELLDKLGGSGTVARVLSGDISAISESPFVLDRLKELSKRSKLLKDNPLLATPVAGADQYMNIVLSNNVDIKDVQMDFGSLTLEDENNKRVRIVKDATPGIIPINGDLNRKSLDFKDVDMTFTTSADPDLEVRVFSQENGQLGSWGKSSFKDLVNVGSEDFAVNVYTNERKLRLLPRNRLESHFSSKELFSSSLDVDSEYHEKADESLEKGYEKISELYEEIKSDGKIDSSDARRIKALERELAINYYDTLNDGDVYASVKATGDKTKKEFSGYIGELGEKMDAYFKRASLSDDSARNIPREMFRLSFNRVLNDRNLQENLASRGLVNKERVLGAVEEQISEVSSFLTDKKGQADRFEFLSDSKNRVYKLRYGTEGAMNVLHLDPALGTLVSDSLPMILGSGEMTDNKDFKIETALHDRRFKGASRNIYSTHTSDVTVREKLDAIKRVGMNKDRIEAYIQKNKEKEVEPGLLNYLEGHIKDTSG